MDIKKTTGEKEAFSPDKLCTSLEAAGVSNKQARHVCNEVEKKLRPGDTTTKIFREAVRHLVKEDVELSARYSLRRGVDDLGPAGFIFERYVEAILQVHGYTTQRNLMMQGECISHEVDVYAEKGEFHYLVEAKYRNDHSIKTHVDQIMYADARLMDIERGSHDNDTAHHVMWMITNTEFTNNAVQYAECRGMKLVGWEYPKKEGNLEDMIVRKKMYPVTVLPAMTTYARDKLAEKGMILAQDLLPYSVEHLMDEFQLPQKTASKLKEQVQGLVK